MNVSLEQVYHEIASNTDLNPNMLETCPKTKRYLNQKQFNANEYTQLLSEFDLLNMNDVNNVIIGYSGTKEIIELFSNSFENTLLLGIENALIEDTIKFESEDPEQVILNGDPSTISIPNTAELYLLLDNAISRVNHSQLEELFGNAYSSLDKGGLLLVEFIPYDKLDGGTYYANKYTENGYTLHHHRISSVQQNPLHLAYVEQIKVTDPTGNSVSLTTHNTEHLHSNFSVKDTASKVGFKRTTLTDDPINPNSMFLIAEK